MVQRISTATRYDRLVADLRMNQYNFNRLTEQLSSGAKITKLTDDPIGAVNVLNTNKQLGRINIYSTNVGMATSELDALDDLMELAGNYLTTAWNKAVQANNQTYGKDSLKALKVEIDEIAKTMVDLANTEFDDNYIFGGANTKLLPYEIAENGDIIYRGTPADNPDYTRQTEVADGVFEVINTTGDKVFGYYLAEAEPGSGVYTDSNGKRVIETVDADGNTVYKYMNGNLYKGDVNDLTPGAKEEAEGVMGALRKLSQGIQMVLDGDEAGGYEVMHATLDKFSEAHNAILNEQTRFGGIYNRLEMTTSTLETTSDSLTSMLAQINSVDYASVITQWINAQYAYQASMQVAAASMNMSLLNYL